MFYFRQLTRLVLLNAIGAISLTAAASANAKDKIAVNARAVFTKAGGTTKDGLSQKQFQAADEKISDALDRMARDGIIGGATPPQVVIKRDLSKKEKISYTEFLQYFRGLASERDLQIRRTLVDQAVAQKGSG